MSLESHYAMVELMQWMALISHRRCLDQARDKKAQDGSPAYTQLIQADLTETIAIESNTYAGIV